MSEPNTAQTVSEETFRKYLSELTLVEYEDVFGRKSFLLTNRDYGKGWNLYVIDILKKQAAVQQTSLMISWQRLDGVIKDPNVEDLWWAGSDLILELTERGSKKFDWRSLRNQWNRFYDYSEVNGFYEVIPPEKSLRSKGTLMLLDKPIFSKRVVKFSENNPFIGKKIVEKLVDLVKADTEKYLDKLIDKLSESLSEADRLGYAVGRGLRLSFQDERVELRRWGKLVHPNLKEKPMTSVEYGSSSWKMTLEDAMSELFAMTHFRPYINRGESIHEIPEDPLPVVVPW